MREKALSILADLGEGEIHPSTKVRELSIGQQQMIEIGRALLRDAKVIAFDEPTSSLSIQEIRQLKRIVKRLRDEGRVVLYVTHRMEEVFEMCDAVTIFRDGQHIRTHEDMSELNHDLLVSEMVGRDIDDVYGYRARDHGDVILNVEGIQGRGLNAPVSFSVKRGEVFGLFGLVGAGRSELLRLVCGVESPKAGSVHFNGETRRFKSPAEAIRAGIAMCPEDRKSQGFSPWPVWPTTSTLVVDAFLNAGDYSATPDANGAMPSRTSSNSVLKRRARAHRSANFPAATSRK